MKRTCTRCKTQKDLGLFVKDKNKPLGHSFCCKQCHNTEARRTFKEEYPKDKEKYLRTRRDYRDRERQKMKEFLSDKSCMDCGNTDWRVFEFDHRDPSIKEFNIGDRLRTKGSFESCAEEIAKCDIVCANCHKIRTYTMINSYRIR